MTTKAQRAAARQILLDWADALESGEYEQGAGMLLRESDEGGEDKWCCLGVLGDLVGYPRDLLNKTATLRTIDWTWSSEAHGWFVHLNDGYDLTFDQIAWVVRQHARTL